MNHHAFLFHPRAGDLQRGFPCGSGFIVGEWFQLVIGLRQSAAEQKIGRVQPACFAEIEQGAANDILFIRERKIGLRSFRLHHHDTGQVSKIHRLIRCRLARALIEFKGLLRWSEFPVIIPEIVECHRIVRRDFQSRIHVQLGVDLVSKFLKETRQRQMRPGVARVSFEKGLIVLPNRIDDLPDLGGHDCVGQPCPFQLERVVAGNEFVHPILSVLIIEQQRPQLPANRIIGFSPPAFPRREQDCENYYPVPDHRAAG